MPTADPAPAAWQETSTSLGGFFTLATDPGASTDAVPWPQVLADDALSARFTTVRSALATSTGMPLEAVDRKVAVSATQVGLASRLWSVGLAAAVLHGWVPDLRSGNLVASPVHRGEVPLGVSDADAGQQVGSLEEAVHVLDRVVVAGSLADLDGACARVGRTPATVLASNSASALVGAARVLAAHRPDQGPRAWALARALLTRTGAARGGSLTDPADLPPGVGGAMEHVDEAFLRSGCCVFYRLPEHGLCPDCVLAPTHPDRVTAAH